MTTETVYKKHIPAKQFTGWDKARFYTIDGRKYPSVTTVLDIINKPALGPWYAKQERQAFESAILEVAASGKTISADDLLERVIKATQGAKAGDLPVEQPTKFELVVNARTAKALGLTIPPLLRLQADRIVE